MGGGWGQRLSPVGSMGEMCPNCHWLQNTIVTLLGERADSRRDCCSSNKTATKTPGISKIHCNKALYLPTASQPLERAALQPAPAFLVTEIRFKYSRPLSPLPPLITSPPSPLASKAAPPATHTLNYCPHGYPQRVCRGNAHPQGSGAVGALQPQRGLLPVLRSGQSGQAPQPAQRVAHKDLQVPLLRRSSRCFC